MAKGTPDPDPVNEISARLESIRARTGFEDSRRKFWQKLKEGWDDPVSYESVRRYHWEREPPVSYLVRVVEVFPQFRLEWLATGEGEPTVWEQEAKEAADGATGSGGAAPGFIQRRLLRPLELKHVPGERARTAILSLWKEIAGRADPYEKIETKQGVEVRRGALVADEIAAALRAPLLELKGHWSVYALDELDTYYVLVAEALQQYLRASWQGEERMNQRLEPSSQEEEDTDG